MIDLRTALMCLGLLASAAALLLACARWADKDPRLARLILLTFGIRALLAISLYVISYWHLPVMPSLQYPWGGFWVFGLDSNVYHYFGVIFADAWRQGVELPNPELGVEYFIVVAGLYSLLGPHPLYPILLNAFFASANALLAHGIGRALGGPRAGLTAAVLVSCWPSSFIWSAQLLKDPLSWLLILGAIRLLVALVDEARERRPALIARAAQVVLLAGAVILLTRLRFYVGSALALASLLVLAPAAAGMAIRGRMRAFGYAGLILVVAGSVLAARSADTLRLFSPPHPEIGHFRLAMRAWQRSDFPEAEQELLRVLRLRPDHLDAYVALAEVRLAQQRADEALEAHLLYYERELRMRRPMARRLIGLTWAVHRGWLRDYAGLPGVDAAVRYAAEFERVPESMPDETVAGELRALKQSLFGASTLTAPLPPERPRLTIPPLLEGLSELERQAIATAHEATPAWLGARREGFISAGGYSLVDAWAQISSPVKLLQYLPRALTIGLLAPFPWHWFDAKGSTGIMRSLGGIEMLLLYLLLPAMAAGTWACARRRHVGGLLIVTFSLLTLIAVSLVVANVGTLFRLRLIFLMPLLIVAAGGDPLRVLRPLAWWRRANAPEAIRYPRGRAVAPGRP
jgi:hypothetical protein